MILTIRHNNSLFFNNEHAVLLATGATHHIVLVLLKT